MASAREEWRTGWPLPFVGMLGYTGAACFAYSSGVFMQAVTKEFGWSRTEFSSAFTVQTLVGMLAMPFVGRLVDKYGSRRIALSAIVPFIGGYGMLSMANGAIWQWWLLCIVMALMASLVGAVVWVKGVVGQFDTSRGLAMSLVLSGSGVAGTIWPILAAFYIQASGWRLAYPALALTWAVVMAPLVWFLIAEKPAAAPGAPKVSGPSISLGTLLRSRTFILLAIAGCLFSPLTLGLMMHMVPILDGFGFGLGEAAALAGLAGIFAIVGRLSTGFLLDRLPARLVSASVFLLPIVVSVLLWNCAGSPLMAGAAIAVLGFVSGADGDVVAYLISRHFDRDVFASAYAPMVALLSLSSSVGPILAGLCFDMSGSYTLYLIVIVPIALVAALLIGSIPSQEPEPKHMLGNQPEAA